MKLDTGTFTREYMFNINTQDKKTTLHTNLVANKQKSYCLKKFLDFICLYES